MHKPTPLIHAIVLILSLLYGCHKPYYIQQHTDRTYAVEKGSAADSNVVKMLQPYKAGVDTQMQVVIGHTDIPLTKAQPESSLGNFAADAQMQVARRIDGRVAGSVVNYGGLQISYIAPGPLTKGKIYELMPFDNKLTIVEIPGETLKQFCDHMAKAKGWPISGINYIIKDNAAADIMINGQPLNNHIVYKIAVSDYVANGGDNCDFLRPLTKRHTNIFCRDAMIDYIVQLEKQNKQLHPDIQKRVQHAE